MPHLIYNFECGDIIVRTPQYTVVDGEHSETLKEPMELISVENGMINLKHTKGICKGQEFSVLEYWYKSGWDYHKQENLAYKPINLN